MLKIRQHLRLLFYELCVAGLLPKAESKIVLCIFDLTVKTFLFLLWPSCHEHNNVDGLYRRLHSFIFLALSGSSNVRRPPVHYSAPRHSHYTSHSDDVTLTLSCACADWLSALRLLCFDSLLTEQDDFLFRTWNVITITERTPSVQSHKVLMGSLLEAQWPLFIIDAKGQMLSWIKHQHFLKSSLIYLYHETKYYKK